MEDIQYPKEVQKGGDVTQSKRKKSKVPDEVHYDCTVRYVEWTGHHRHLKRIDHEVSGCTLEIYGATAHFHDGIEWIKKRTSSAYFSFITAESLAFERLLESNKAEVQLVRQKLKEVLERKRIYVAPYFDNFERNPETNRIQPLPNVEVPWIEKTTVDVLALFDGAYGRNGYQSSLDYARRTLNEIHSKHGTRIGLWDAVRVWGNRKSVLKMAA